MKRKPVRIGDTVQITPLASDELSSILRYRYVENGEAKFLLEESQADALGVKVESWKKSHPIISKRLNKILDEIEARGNLVDNEREHVLNDPNIYKIVRRARKK